MITCAPQQEIGACAKGIENDASAPCKLFESCRVLTTKLVLDCHERRTEKERGILGKRVAYFFGLALSAVVAGWALWPSVVPDPLRGNQPDAATSASKQESREAKIDEGDVPTPSGQRREANFGRHEVVPTATGIFKALPPVTTPLRLAYRELKEQAQAGNASAQCRLGYELRRCKLASERKQMIRRAATGGVDQQTNADAPGQISPIAQQFAIDDSVCEGFTPEAGDEAWRYTLQAALNGNEAAALAFIYGPAAGLDPRRPGATFDGWEAYRQYAPQLLQQEIAQGNPAAYLLAAQNSLQSLWGIPIISHDRVQAAAFYFALMPSATATFRPSLLSGIQRLDLTPSDVVQAQTRASSLSANVKAPIGGTDLSNGLATMNGKPPDGSQCGS